MLEVAYLHWDIRELGTAWEIAIHVSAVNIDVIIKCAVSVRQTR